jgi:hypothetical protein
MVAPYFQSPIRFNGMELIQLRTLKFYLHLKVAYTTLKFAAHFPPCCILQNEKVAGTNVLRSDVNIVSFFSL